MTSTELVDPMGSVRGHLDTEKSLTHAAPMPLIGLTFSLGADALSEDPAASTRHKKVDALRIYDHRENGFDGHAGE